MKRIQCLIILSLVSMAIPAMGASAAAADDTPVETSTPIEHIVVVMQQNHTFDNYFGTYPGANGLPANTCIPITLPDPGDGSCLAPFRIGSYPIMDLSHSFDTFRNQYQAGRMNGFVSALNAINHDGTLAMGYYDDSNIPYYWNLADEFVLFDNYFSSAHTGSITNRMFWVSGQPGDGTNRIPEGGFSDIPTIFDRLQERGISWKFYIKHYDPTLSYRSLADLDYLPPQIQWVPLLSMDRFLDDPELSSRIVDLEEYYTDLENGTLPAVSYVLLLGATEHPISDLRLGQRTNQTMIQTLMQSDAWSKSAYIITYDDWGGWYDHVPPPQVDQYGYGFRVPTLLVSPYARRGHIDHTRLDHTSILKFIETNWEIPPLADRDARANNLTSAFDFASPPRQPAFVSAERHVPEPSSTLRHNVIYIAYGAAIVLAVYILIQATLIQRKLPPPSPYAPRTQERI